jgi:hypothetical protein
MDSTIAGLVHAQAEVKHLLPRKVESVGSKNITLQNKNHNRLNINSHKDSPGLKTRTCNVLYYIAENLVSNEYKHSMLRDHMYWQNCKYTGKKNPSNNKQIIKCIVTRQRRC